MLAGLAALPAAGPAIATAAVDPLFDLIDAHRVAQVAHLAAIHEAGRLEGLHGGDITAKPCDDENDAWAALLETAAGRSPKRAASPKWLGRLKHEDLLSFVKRQKLDWSWVLEGNAAGAPVLIRRPALRVIQGGLR